MIPFLFNTEMVKAILEGRKTVTRRVVKFKQGQNPAWSGYIPDGAVLYGSNNIPAAKAPFRAGDILWVRETWSRVETGQYLYRADNENPLSFLGWRPSIHMPLEAARIFLRVTCVRVERLQEITEEGAEAEGCRKWCEGSALEVPARSYFCNLWDSTIKPKDRPTYGWEANPWVWVIEFERISKEEANHDES